MSFTSSVLEFFKGKKEPVPTTPTTPTTPEANLAAKQQELDNLVKVQSSPAGSDFRSPQTDALDQSRMEQLRTQIAAESPIGTTTPTAEPQPSYLGESQDDKPLILPQQPQVETQPTAIPVAPIKQPTEQPKAA